VARPHSDSLLFMAAVLLVPLFAACGRSNQTSTSVAATVVGFNPVDNAGLNACPPSGAASSVTGAGSTFDAPLFAKLFDLYNQECRVQVNYQSVGSGAGIEQLTQRTVNFGASDAPLTDQQIKAAGGNVLHIPVTIGAVTVGYNLPGIGSGLRLSGDVLAQIFLGRIKKWSDPSLRALNPKLKLPDLDISVVHRSDGSGTSFIFTSYLSAVSAQWRLRVGSGTSVSWPVGAGGKGSEGVAGVVKLTPGSIGYFELAFSALTNISNADIQSRDGQFVTPSVQSAAADAAGAAADLPADLRATFVNAPGAGAYPITGFSWVVIDQAQSDPRVAQTLVSLLWWAIHGGQEYASALKYAPLPPAVVQRDVQQLQKVTVNGRPVLTH
jgi:phosphate transport system substrate-binding protein